jgi:hypothetical protein
MYGSPELTPMKPRSRLPRLTLIAVITAGLLLLLGLFAPQQLPVVLYKVALVTLGAMLGYWIDRALFPYARPHSVCTGTDYWPRAMAMIRRALIVLACVLGLTLGL